MFLLWKLFFDIKNGLQNHSLHTHIHTHTHTHRHICTHACTHTRTLSHTHTQTCTLAHTHKQKQKNAHTSPHGHLPEVSCNADVQQLDKKKQFNIFNSIIFKQSHCRSRSNSMIFFVHVQRTSKIDCVQQHSNDQALNTWI